MKPCLVIVLTLFSTGVFSQQLAEDTIFDAEGQEEKKMVKIIDRQIREINEIFNSEPERVELYLQLRSSDFIKQVLDYSKAPDSFYASYNIIRDENGEIAYINEVPRFSDKRGHLSYDYYFSSGQLVAFTRFSTTSYADCAETVNEESTWYYNPQHALVKKTYVIYDQHRRLLDPAKCTFSRESYSIVTNLDTYLAEHHFVMK